MSLLRRLERVAEAIERRTPVVRWDVLGDLASWIQHTAVCAFAAIAGGVLAGLAVQDFSLGARVASGLSLFVYAIKERGEYLEHARQRHARWKWERRGVYLKVGFVADMIGDLAGPIAVHVWTWCL
jgi:hypothetical protein